MSRTRTALAVLAVGGATIISDAVLTEAQTYARPELCSG